MVDISFEENYKDIFESIGISEFDDFYNFQDGNLINKNSRRNVIHMVFDILGRKTEFYMKRFHNPHLKDVLHTIVNHGSVCTQASSEYQYAQHLFENGIETYHPVCYGQKTLFGLERKSFFITKKIDGICLTDYITENWESIDRNQKENVVLAMGKIARKLHNARISMPCLFVWHLFLLNDALADNRYEFAVIDLHRAKINMIMPCNYWRNLGDLYFSMSEERFDDDLRQILLDAYIAEGHPIDKKILKSRIFNRAKKVRSRRQVPDY